MLTYHSETLNGLAGDRMKSESSGIYVPSGEIPLSLEDSVFLSLVVDLISPVSDLQLLSSSSELAGLSHDEFISGEYVKFLIKSIQEHLIVLSEATPNPYLKDYLVKLSEDFPFIIQPSSPSEVAYGGLMAHAKLGQLNIKIGFLHDYNYENDPVGKNPDRRDLVLIVSRIVSHNDVPEGFVSVLEEFFQTQGNTEVLIVEEVVVFFSASQNDRVRLTGVVPSGSSHNMNRPDGGERILVRRYVNTGKERVETAISMKDLIFNEGFFNLNGIDRYDSDNMRKVFSRGQYFDLTTHEMTEGRGTFKFSGSNRPLQECLYTVLGVATLASLKEYQQVKSNDLLATRIYLLTKICTILASDNTGVYIPGFALIYNSLVKRRAIEFDENGFIGTVNWELFDGVMQEIAKEIHSLLTVSPDPLIDIDRYVDIARDNWFIKMLRQRTNKASQ